MKGVLSHTQYYNSLGLPGFTPSMNGEEIRRGRETVERAETEEEEDGGAALPPSPHEQECLQRDLSGTKTGSPGVLAGRNVTDTIATLLNTLPPL